jgi:Restriction endonuclease
MNNPVVFYSRCKPQNVDIIKIALEQNRIFIGHPFLKPGSTYDPKNLRNCIVDLTCPDDEWENYLRLNQDSEKKRNYSKNRNFVKKIGMGSIALIPRPSIGIIFVGKIESDFQLINEPSWASDYKKIRGIITGKTNDFDDSSKMHSADISQCWRVNKFVATPFTKFPRWILRSLFGRSTYGIISDNIEKTYDVIEGILRGENFRKRDFTNELNEIERRLKEDLSPSEFEHLMVSIFQLENRNEIWWHTGGSGDGGLDGVGANESGEIVSLLQCKLSIDSKTAIFDLEANDLRFIENKRRIVASIFHDIDFRLNRTDIEFFGISRIAKLVRKYSSLLPQAVSMRIGSSQ